MKPVSIEASVPERKEGDKVVQVALAGQVTVQYPETVAEALQVYGEEAILSNAFANWKVVLQANIRNGLKRGETIEAIQARLSDAKMGVATQGARQDPVQAYLAAFQSATPEKQKEMLAELQKRAAGPAKAKAAAN